MAENKDLAAELKNLRDKPDHNVRQAAPGSQGRSHPGSLRDHLNRATITQVAREQGGAHEVGADIYLLSRSPSPE